MMAHALTMVWRRRRHGFLLATEIFVSFLVVFAVATMVVHALDNLATPTPDGAQISVIPAVAGG